MDTLVTMGTTVTMATLLDQIPNRRPGSLPEPNLQNPSDFYYRLQCTNEHSDNLILRIL